MDNQWMYLKVVNLTSNQENASEIHKECDTKVNQSNWAKSNDC